MLGEARPHRGGPLHPKQSSSRGVARSAQTNAGLWEPPLVATDRRTPCSFQPTAPLADTDGHLRSSRRRAILECDAQADVPLAEASGATCVQRLDDSRDSAIHTKYRISLHSSSWREPRYPLPRVVILLCFSLLRSTRTHKAPDRTSMIGFLRCAMRTRMLGLTHPALRAPEGCSEERCGASPPGRLANVGLAARGAARSDEGPCHAPLCVSSRPDRGALRATSCTTQATQQGVAAVPTCRRRNDGSLAQRRARDQYEWTASTGAEARTSSQLQPSRAARLRQAPVAIEVGSGSLPPAGKPHIRPRHSIEKPSTPTAWNFNLGRPTHRCAARPRVRTSLRFWGRGRGEPPSPTQLRDSNRQ